VIAFVQLLLRSTRNGRLPLTRQAIISALSRIKADTAISPIERSIRERIQCALDEYVYPALLEAVHRAPTYGPSPGWAKRVISLVEEQMGGNGHDVPFEPLHGSQRIAVEKTLDHAFDVDGCRYKPGKSDQWVADQVNITLAQATEIRQTRYGELKPEPGIEEWNLMHQEFIADIEKERASTQVYIEGNIKRFEDQAKLLTEQMLKLDKQLKETKELQAEINREHAQITDCRKVLHKHRDDINERCNKTIQEHNSAIGQDARRRKHI
jgi:hypothetical protein